MIELRNVKLNNITISQFRNDNRIHMMLTHEELITLGYTNLLRAVAKDCKATGYKAIKVLKTQEHDSELIHITIESEKRNSATNDET